MTPLPQLLPLLWIFCSIAQAPAGTAPALFPPLEGWTLEAPVQTYTPETLFDYIDGAAEVYLSYDFERLEVATYRQGKGSMLTVEAYRHASPEDAFGIFARERPEGLAPSTLGAAAAVQDDRASFASGPYYVKIAASGPPEGRSGLPLRLARLITERLGSTPRLPEPFSIFPAEARVAGSERYFAKEYLGYACLPRAFSVRYGSGAQGREAFMIALKDGPEAEGMAGCLAGQKGTKVLSKGPGAMALAVPYHGTLRLGWDRHWLWGVKGEGADAEALSSRLAASIPSLSHP